MTYAGFVLAGGRSSRMGRDKALLPYKTKTLLEHVAEQVLGAAGSVTLIGDRDSYQHLGYAVVPDRVPEECGPLGGVYTALGLKTADWSLIVACDFPSICVRHLQHILEEADMSVDCVVPVLDNGDTQPLCALYHQRCLLKIENILQRKQFRMMDFVRCLSTKTLSGWTPPLFTNINSPADWARIK